MCIGMSEAPLQSAQRAIELCVVSTHRVSAAAAAAAAAAAGDMRACERAPSALGSVARQSAGDAPE